MPLCAASCTYRRCARCHILRKIIANIRRIWKRQEILPPSFRTREHTNELTMPVREGIMTPTTMITAAALVRHVDYKNQTVQRREELEAVRQKSLTNTQGKSIRDFDETVKSRCLLNFSVFLSSVVQRLQDVEGTLEGVSGFFEKQREFFEQERKRRLEARLLLHSYRAEEDPAFIAKERKKQQEEDRALRKKALAMMHGYRATKQSIWRWIQSVRDQKEDTRDAFECGREESNDEIEREPPTETILVKDLIPFYQQFSYKQWIFGKTMATQQKKSLNESLPSLGSSDTCSLTVSSRYESSPFMTPEIRYESSPFMSSENGKKGENHTTEEGHSEGFHDSEEWTKTNTKEIPIEIDLRTSFLDHGNDCNEDRPPPEALFPNWPRWWAGWMVISAENSVGLMLSLGLLAYHMRSPSKCC